MSTVICTHNLLNNRGNLYRCAVGCNKVIKAICIMPKCPGDALPLNEKEHGQNYYRCATCLVKQHIVA